MGCSSQLQRVARHPPQACHGERGIDSGLAVYATVKPRPPLAIGLGHECRGNERQRERQQQVVMGSTDYLSVKQAVQGALRTTPGASQAGERKKWASGKKVRAGGIESEIHHAERYYHRKDNPQGVSFHLAAFCRAPPSPCHRVASR